jgi:hypothetical protein
MSDCTEFERQRRSRRERLDPAKSVVNKFKRYDPDKKRWVNGEYVLAERMGCSPSRILRWMYSADSADGGRTPGTGGLIPARRHPELLRIAADLGIKLEQRDLYPRLPVVS